MFTGLVRESALVADVRREASKLVLQVVVAAPEAAQWGMGASIAVNGVCLTLVASREVSLPLGAREPKSTGCLVNFEVSPESLDRTNLGKLRAGSRVHLESSLKVGDPLGGHWVSGHVDGLGRLRSVEQVQEFRKLVIEVSGDAWTRIAPFLVEKGSIAVDGVSLTVNSVRDEGPGRTSFELMLIPHTLEITRLGEVNVGDDLNLEADMLAKYVCRYRDFERLR